MWTSSETGDQVTFKTIKIVQCLDREKHKVRKHKQMNTMILSGLSAFPAVAAYKDPWTTVCKRAHDKELVYSDLPVQTSLVENARQELCCEPTLSII